MSQPRKYKAKLAAPTRAKMIGISEPVTIKAAEPTDGVPGGPPTFSALAYSGGVISRKTIEGAELDANYIIDLSGMKRARNVVGNLRHKDDQLVGHATEVNIGTDKVELSGIMSQPTPYRDQVAGAAANDFAWEISIEAGLSKPRKLAAGKTATVNGRQVTGPLYIFGSSTLTGFGFVSHGADEGNLLTIAATADNKKEPSMNEFEKYVASLGLDHETISDEVRGKLQVAFDAIQGKPAPVSNGRKSFRDLAEAERQENARQEAIVKMGHDAMREAPLYIDQIEVAVADAIESKLSTEKFELELMRSLRTKAGAFQSRANSKSNDPRVLEAAICMAAGLPNIEKHYAEPVLDAVDRAGMRNFSLQQMLMQTANANGYSCRAGERIHAGNLRAVLEYCFPPVHARLAGFSSVSMPNILGNVANKMILAGYMEEDPTWREIATIKSVSNFHQHSHYRMLDSLEYDEVGSGGELNHGKLGEENYTSQAKTYGKMLGITRTQIINDDLGAFDDLRARLGRGAAKKFNNVFWAAFMNNASFFTTALTNYIEGSTTNLGTDGVGLGLGVKACRTMTTPTADGTKRIGNGFTPTILLAPPELETNAEILYRNQNLGAVGSSSANIYANRYRPVIQNRLSDSAFTGNSTTAWYLFGNDLKPMLVSFLNGQQTPTVESTDAEFSTLGIQFRGYHDFGCDKSEYLAGVKSKGAA